MPAPRLVRALVLVGLLPVSAFAQNMALTPPVEPAKPAPPAVERPLPPPRPQARIVGGELPNQRTGVGKQRAVRDICIGCDR